MKFTKLATVALATIAVSVPVAADLMFPSLSYRTGPYAAGGAPFADGYADFFTLMNERDGGIGGAKVVLEECETGFSTPKGVECYEATKNDGALLYQPLSTGMTYQLIPKATADGIPILTSGYGRTISLIIMTAALKAKVLPCFIITLVMVKSLFVPWKLWLKSMVLR